MKKQIPILICVALLAALPSCDRGQAAETAEDSVYEVTSEEEAVSISIPETGGFSDYGSILALYRKTVQSVPFMNTNPEAAIRELQIQNEAERELFQTLYAAAAHGFPRREDAANCGYAVKDLNGDGVRELIWLARDGQVLAVFSSENGETVCLGVYGDRRNSCRIDPDGYLHEFGSSGADNSVYRVCRVATGGASLEVMEEFGTDGHQWVDGVAVTKYYQTVNGARTSITEAAYRGLFDRYAISAFPKEGEGTDDGIGFIPLFAEAEGMTEISREEAVQIASEYWNIRPGDKDPDNGFQYALIPVENQTENPHVHVIMLKWLVEGTHYSTVDEIWVDRITGEIVQPNWYRTLYGTLFEWALSNQYALHIGDTGEMAYLKDIRTPYLGIPLTEMWEDISYAYLDMDGDGIEECVLFCGVDILILRGHEGRGYLYAFPFNHMNTLYADGSFSWSDNGAYGQSRLTFDGINARIRELWRVKGDGTPDAVYFVEGQQVTKTELDAFVAACPAAPLEWTPMDVPLLTDGK